MQVLRLWRNMEQFESKRSSVDIPEWTRHAHKKKSGKKRRQEISLLDHRGCSLSIMLLPDPFKIWKFFVTGHPRSPPECHCFGHLSTENLQIPLSNLLILSRRLWDREAESAPWASDMRKVWWTQRIIAAMQAKYSVLIQIWLCKQEQESFLIVIAQPFSLMRISPI